MVTQVTRDTADVVIFTEGNSVDNYRVTYELRVTLTNEIETAIETRLRKSFSLGQSFPDAYNLRGIDKKATLMQNIFQNEYGLTSVVVSLIIPEESLVPNIGTATIDE